MEIKKTELLEALSKVKPALSNKAIIEQTDHFIFDNDFVRTYNDEIAISYPFKSGIKAAVKASEFYKLVSKIDKEKIDLSSDGPNINISVSDKEKGRIISQTEIICPAVEISSRRWMPLPKEFTAGIRLCSFSADKNMLMRELTCLFIKDEFIVSSDNFRATKYIMTGKFPVPILLPATIATELSKYDAEKYIIEDSWIHFKNKEEIIFSSRIVLGEYPEQVFDLFNPEGDKVEIPKDLKSGVDKAGVFVEGINSDDLICLEAKDGTMTCRGEGTLGEWNSDYEIKYKKEFKAKVSSEALKEILSYTSDMTVSEDKLYFKADNFEHVICLSA